MMAVKQWSVADFLRSYGPIVARRVGLIALGWVPIFFISQPIRGTGIPTLFAPLLGAMAGVVAGWYMATNAAEDSGLEGWPLWIILVAGGVAPIWLVDWMLREVFPTWPFDFGGWMLLSFASLMALASAIWHASTQE